MVQPISQAVALVLLISLLTGQATAQGPTSPNVGQLNDKTSSFYLDRFALIDLADNGDTRAFKAALAGISYVTPRRPSTGAEATALLGKVQDGDREAMIEAALAYLWGWGLPQDDGLALSWAIKASDSGSANAMRLLGDLAFGREFNWDARAGGFSLKMGLLGGERARSPKEIQVALAWYRRAADAGDARALERLGEMSLMGDGVPESASDGVAWLEKAADRGSLLSMSTLAGIYAHGLGERADYANPYLTADPRLRVLNEWRTGVYPDHDKALAWYDRAVKQAPMNDGYHNAACWMRAEDGRELDAALTDCEAAVRLNPGEPEYWDSLALVQLRLGDMKQAEAAYDAAVQRYEVVQRVGNRETARSLYGRGVARIKLGDVAAGQQDISHALAVNSKVADTFRAYGVSP